MGASVQYIHQNKGGFFKTATRVKKNASGVEIMKSIHFDQVLQNLCFRIVQVWVNFSILKIPTIWASGALHFQAIF